VRDEVLVHPSIQRIGRVAQALGKLVDEVVFIGGSIAPLLQTEPPFEGSRPTKDADGVIASSTYSDIEPLHKKLRALGFRQKPGETAHMHRWWSPDGDAFDLVPVGSHPGGSGQEWDGIALRNSVTVELGNGLIVRHASAPAFLALKWAAYIDRGAGDPYASHDMEDIIALVASRGTIVAEVREAPMEVRDFVVSQTSVLLDDERLPDIMAGHLNNAQAKAQTVQLAHSRLRDIRSISVANPSDSTAA
jgi:hypothetical protein